MNDQFATALIGLLGVLLGTALSSIVAWLINRAATGSQQAMATQAKADAMEKLTREERRSAYVQFLASLDAVNRAAMATYHKVRAGELTGSESGLIAAYDDPVTEVIVVLRGRVRLWILGRVAVKFSRHIRPSQPVRRPRQILSFVDRWLP